MILKLQHKYLIHTPAKLNFYLYIVQKRKDGFHNLNMDMHPISLFDQITFSPADDGQFLFHSNLEETSENNFIQNNLVIRAMHLLEDYCKVKFSIHISLRKSIPVSAGLGGGSGNAAGTLVFLNKQFKLGISKKELTKMSLHLGSDVPFFINPKSVLVEGKGELLTKTSKPKNIYLLLLYPQIHINTKIAYQNCTISGNTQTFNYSKNNLKNIGVDSNDFWKWILKQYPEILEAKKMLLTTNPLCVGLSGSGSTLFGIFDNQQQRDDAWTTLNAWLDWDFYPCEILNQHLYNPVIL